MNVILSQSPRLFLENSNAPANSATLLIMGRLVHSKGAQCMRDQSSQHPKGRIMVVHEVGSKEIPESSTSHTHSPERDIKGGIQPCAVC